MAIKTIPLSRLETELKQTLNECIQPPDPQEDDTLMDELLASNPKFQALVKKSKASPRKPFVAGDQGLTNG